MTHQAQDKPHPPALFHELFQALEVFFQEGGHTYTYKYSP